MCRLTILFPGKLCESAVEQSGITTDPVHDIGHIRLDATGLIAWLHAAQAMPCKEQHDGSVDAEATVAPENAQAIARSALHQLELRPDASEEQIKIAIAKKGLAII